MILWQNRESKRFHDETDFQPLKNKENIRRAISIKTVRGGTASPGSWAGPSAGSPAPQEPESANRLSMDAVNTGV